MLRTNADTETLDALATGVARLDGEGRVVHANHAFAELVGCGASRLHGHTLAILKPAGDHLHAQVAQARAEDISRTFRDVTVCAAPGHEAHLDFTFTPTTGGSLVEVHPALPTAPTPRVSESLRGFAHEIRNPLAAISGAAQLLQQGTADTRQRELAQLIRDESQRLAELSERLLGARNQMATRAINVHALLERVAELLAAEPADVVLVRDYDPSLPAWHGDPDRLLQALLNLVRNAVEANAHRIVLRSRAEAGWRDRHDQRVPALRLEVEDDGDGVPDALAATLFEPLVSGHAGGSGLGLSLAREIAREHGGELAWQRRGRGTCFTLLLPRRPHGGAA
ncbi:MAG TPA: ATP-binding protein [Rhodanobacteraceae bacterium]|jgi:two-component system nitrogen regulation sensor histidine kinase GlnL|nr:ATP-binding protein [Rhodanobacteraceae bacterium]